MATWYKYRVYCNTDSKNEETLALTEPTTCPTNTAHTIDSSKTVIIETKAPNIVKIKYGVI